LILQYKTTIDGHVTSASQQEHIAMGHHNQAQNINTQSAEAGTTEAELQNYLGMVNGWQ